MLLRKSNANQTDWNREIRKKSLLTELICIEHF